MMTDIKQQKQPIVIIKDLKKTYLIGKEKVRALRGIDLTIDKGDIVMILGTSGSGKSTLLNLLAGLEKPTQGSVEILGEQISHMSERKLAKFRQKHVGFIFQSYNLLPMFTALENVGLPLVFRGIALKKRDKEAAHLLKAVGLGTHMLHKPTQMSGGQQQRVGIARAFAGSPDIIFADEPTGNLDSKTSEQVMELMLDLAKEKNQTMIMVTHDREIAKYGDKVVVIRDGNILEIIDNTKEIASSDEKTMD